jgi:hypothetical protein
LGKFHSKAPAAQLAAELLTKQHLDVRLVIDDKNKKCHDLPPLSDQK